jgi:hypothetical protein
VGYPALVRTIHHHIRAGQGAFADPVNLPNIPR